MDKVYKCVDGKMILVKVLEDKSKEQIALENCKKCKRYKEDADGNQIPCENKQREHWLYPFFECYIGEDFGINYYCAKDNRANRTTFDR